MDTPILTITMVTRGSTLRMGRITRTSRWGLRS